MKRPLQGRYADCPVWLRVCQWLLCMVLLTCMAVGLWATLPNRESIGSLKLLQLLQTVAIFLLPPLLMAYLWSKEPFKWLHLDRKIPIKPALFGVVLLLVASPGINLLSYLNQQMTLPECLSGLEAWMQQQEEASSLLTERFLRVDSGWGLLGNLALMALLPAIAEELTFRGVLQHLFTSRKCTGVPHAAIWATAIVFSAIHCQFYGFVPRMLLGALFGYALVWSGNLWLPMLMHFTNNALAVVVYFAAYKAGWDIANMDVFGTGSTLWVGIVSIVAAGAGVYLLRRSLTMSNASSRMSDGN